MEKKIVKYLIKCGIRPNLKGFMYLHKAIEKTINNGNVLPSVTKEVYPAIAREFNDTASKVERAIRHAIKTSYNHAYMTNGEFIANAVIDLNVR